MSEQQPQFDTKTRLCCVLAYFSVLFFLPLVVAPNDQRARFHANQGLVLCLAHAIGNALIAVVCIFITSPDIKNAIYTIFKLVSICFCILVILHVVREEQRPLPFIGKITLIK